MRSVVYYGRLHVRYLGKQISCALGDFLLIYDRTHPYGRLERQAVIVTLNSYFVRLMAGRIGRPVLFTAWPRRLADACH